MSNTAEWTVEQRHRSPSVARSRNDRGPEPTPIRALHGPRDHAADASTTDLLLVGGGLQAGLIALATLHHRPQTKITIVERGEHIGGTHTWSFHDDDIRGLEWFAPLRAHHWPGYDVVFPGRRRTLARGYSTFTSRHLHAVVSRRIAASPGSELIFGELATELDERGVTVADRRIVAKLVVDCRGPGRGPAADEHRGGWQKFVGLILELDAAHGVELPIVMDATVEQVDGYRFVYVLPFSPTRLLVEDTCFSNHRGVDIAAARERVLAYVSARGWRVREECGQEHGALPMPTRTIVARVDTPLAGGYAGGWFHPTTGYSIPVAARLAEFLATRAPGQARGSGLTELAEEIRTQQRFGLLLNQLMFEHAQPGDRWRLFERFYGLSPALISRFYGLRTTRLDRLRLLVGAPPRGVSLFGALAAVFHYLVGGCEAGA